MAMGKIRQASDPRSAYGPSHVLMLFIDGLGMGASDPRINPVCSGACPVLQDLVVHHARPIDACLGVPGLPQSATGQTTLLTGRNAPMAVGRHIEGFPDERLRAMIREHNIFRRVLALRRSAAFANAYYAHDTGEVAGRRRLSVTTVAALAAFGDVRKMDLMRQGAAVCQDLTRETLRARGYDGPLITPEESAAHLLTIAASHDFTLFEYFLSDRAGHSGEMAAAVQVLATLDRFVAVLARAAAAGGPSLVITSDHGNIEDMRIRTHTRNPVPLIVLGRDAAEWDGVASLTEVTPAILRGWGGEGDDVPPSVGETV